MEDFEEPSTVFSWFCLDGSCYTRTFSNHLLDAAWLSEWDKQHLPEMGSKTINDLHGSKIPSR